MKHRHTIGIESSRASRGSLAAVAAGTALFAVGALAQQQAQQAEEQVQQEQQQLQQEQQQAQDQLRQGQQQAEEQLQEGRQQAEDRLQQGQQQAQQQDEPAVALLDQSAFVEEAAEARATVMEIDAESRIVSLRSDEGEEFTVQVAEDVDLGRVGVGDTVDIVYYRALAAEVTAAPPGRSPVVIATSEAPIDEPGGAVGLVHTAIVTIDEVDTETNTVMFTNPEGEPREVVVQRPEFQEFLAGLSEGDTVQVTYGEALAVSLTPAE